MMNIKKLDGKVLALLLMGEDAAGEEDWVVLASPIHCVQGHLHFAGDTGTFVIPDEFLSRIEPIRDKAIAKILLDADLMLSLTVGSLPQDADDSFIQTELKWPTG